MSINTVEIASCPGSVTGRTNKPIANGFPTNWLELRRTPRLVLHFMEKSLMTVVAFNLNPATQCS